MIMLTNTGGFVPRVIRRLAVLLPVLVVFCPRPVLAFDPPETVTIAAGGYIAGSDDRERDYAYRLDEKAYGHSLTRRQGWYEREYPRHAARLPAFDITRTPITNADYARFLAATDHRRPFVSARVWAGYRLAHPYARAKRYNWPGRTAPAGRGRHPVVLVSHGDAAAYARWLSAMTGARWRLPTESEWEKAARGASGNTFPWGNRFDPARLNSHDQGPFDTVAVGSYPQGASPFGLLDGAGQVYEWTATAAGKTRHVVKGGSWDDKGCGVCRPAARHSRPDDLKHILIGFRLVREIP